MTRKQVHEKVAELTRGQSDEELELLVTQLFANRGGFTVTDKQWAELEAASESGQRGEGIRVDDIDAFVDEIERSA